MKGYTCTNQSWHSVVFLQNKTPIEIMFTLIIAKTYEVGKLGQNMCRWPHPLAALPGFEPCQIRFCTMHVCNLGILQSLNGSLTSLLCEKGPLDSEIFACWGVAYWFVCFTFFTETLHNVFPFNFPTGLLMIFYTQGTYFKCVFPLRRATQC